MRRTWNLTWKFRKTYTLRNWKVPSYKWWARAGLFGKFHKKNGNLIFCLHDPGWTVSDIVLIFWQKMYDTKKYISIVFGQNRTKVEIVDDNCFSCCSSFITFIVFLSDIESFFNTVLNFWRRKCFTSYFPCSLLYEEYIFVIWS